MDEIGQLFPMTTVNIKVTAEEMRIAWMARADRIDKIAEGLSVSQRQNDKRKADELKSYAETFRYIAEHIVDIKNGYVISIDYACRIGIIDPIGIAINAGRFGGCDCG